MAASKRECQFHECAYDALSEKADERSEVCSDEGAEAGVDEDDTE